MKNLSLGIKVKAVNEDEFTIRAVFSTPTEDRHGEIVKQEGWKLDNFLQNPVVLWCHDNYAPAIGRVQEIGIVDGNLEGTIKFAAKEYPFAETIYNLMAGEYINAISVGFINRKWQYDDVNEQMILLENELLEVSVVNVPANQLALAKSKGVDISVIEKRTEKAEAIREKIVSPENETKVITTQDVPDTATETGKEKLDTEDLEDLNDEEDTDEVETHNPAPTDDTEKAIDGIVAAREAIEVLSKSDNGVIEAAVKELTRTLDAAKSSQHGSNADAQKGVSFKQINRVIRRLHKGKAQTK